ncbi:MAG: hypothetical protein JRF52_08970 [Deltaproteobacteria bacterium]|nr:hypothetical protein [Deltaproteobacteria bacterium]
MASLGEITRWQDVLRGDDRIRELIGIARSLGKRVDGHTAGAKYERLNVLSRSGMESCHESINGQQLLDRVRLGLYVMLRHSSLRPDLPELVKTVVSNGISMDRMRSCISIQNGYHKPGNIFSHGWVYGRDSAGKIRRYPGIEGS